MHRVYNSNGQLIFTENSNSLIGKPVGVILETDVNKWAFFASTSDGFDLEAMKTITDKLMSLRDQSDAEEINEIQLVFNADDF